MISAQPSRSSPSPLTDKGQTGAQGLERRDEGLRATGEMGGIHLDAAYVQLTFVDRLVVKTPHLDRGQLGQLARQIFDVNAGAAVNVGGYSLVVSRTRIVVVPLGRAGGGNGGFRRCVRSERV